MRGRWVAIVTVGVLVACGSSGGSNNANSSTSTASGTTTSTTAASGPPVEPVDVTTTPVVYEFRNDEGVVVRYRILASESDPLVTRVRDYHDGVGETRPLTLVQAEIHNGGKELFEVGDIEVTQGTGDVVHFIEAWLHVGRWRLDIRGQTEHPLYMEGFDLDNDLVEAGIVEPGTSAVTVLGAEEVLSTVQSVTARDRDGELKPATRVG